MWARFCVGDVQDAEVCFQQPCIAWLNGVARGGGASGMLRASRVHSPSRLIVSRTRRRAVAVLSGLSDGDHGTDADGSIDG